MMKNKVLILYTLLITIASCSSNTDTEDTIIQTDLSLDTATRTAILDELETILTKEEGIVFKYESSKIIEIGNKKYLRARSGDFVTTTLLVKDKYGVLSRGFSCTTEACSNSTQYCQPLVDFCTPCPGGDCKTLPTQSGIYETSAD